MISRKKILIPLGVVLLVGILSFGAFFFFTGGMGLARIIQYSLIPNIANKQYTWSDFMDRGPGQKINGFYSSSDNKSFSMWTLSGLKTFYVGPESKEFYYLGLCEAIVGADLANDSGYYQEAMEINVGDFGTWRGKMKKEYFVTVETNVNKPNEILRVWSRSGKYKQVGVIDTETCK